MGGVAHRWIASYNVGTANFDTVYDVLETTNNFMVSDILHLNNIWCVCGEQRPAAGGVLYTVTSPDRVVWTENNIPTHESTGTGTLPFPKHRLKEWNSQFGMMAGQSVAANLPELIASADGAAWAVQGNAMWAAATNERNGFGAENNNFIGDLQGLRRVTQDLGVSWANAGGVLVGTAPWGDWTQILGTQTLFHLVSNSGGVAVENLYTSVNSGVAWAAVAVAAWGGATRIRTICSTANGNLVVGASNGIYRSVNAGLNWALVQAGVFNNIWQHPDSNTLWAVEDGAGTLTRVWTSNDDGATWAQFGNNYNGPAGATAVTPYGIGFPGQDK